MADRDGVSIYAGTYSSEPDARLDHEAVKVLRECEVGYYDAAAVTGFALHTAAATVADLSSTKHRQRELATRFGPMVATTARWPSPSTRTWSAPSPMVSQTASAS